MTVIATRTPGKLTIPVRSPLLAAVLIGNSRRPASEGSVEIFGVVRPLIVSDRPVVSVTEAPVIAIVWPLTDAVPFPVRTMFPWTGVPKSAGTSISISVRVDPANDPVRSILTACPAAIEGKIEDPVRLPAPAVSFDATAIPLPSAPGTNVGEKLFLGAGVPVTKSALLLLVSWLPLTRRIAARSAAIGGPARDPRLGLRSRLHHRIRPSRSRKDRWKDWFRLAQSIELDKATLPFVPPMPTVPVESGAGSGLAVPCDVLTGTLLHKEISARLNRSLKVGDLP